MCTTSFVSTTQRIPHSSMLMEAEHEVASAAEAPVAPEAYPKVVERLHQVTAERQRWIAKREAALARQELLLELLQLQGPKNSNTKQIALQKADNEAELAKKEEDKADKAASATLARKKEMKELLARAESAREKQQAAATVLARNLKQLQAKRKREEKEAGVQPRKKAGMGSKESAVIVAAVPEMHPFAYAPDLDVGTAEQAKAACFRIATHHLAQTGTMMSRKKLEQAFKTYTGKVLDEVVDWPLVELALASLTEQIVPPSKLSTRRRAVCWQPGRQFLKTPTFVSSNAGRIQSLIELEKDVVVAVCDSLQVSDNRDLKSTTFIRRRRQRQFLDTLLADGATTPTLSAVLSARVGVNLVKPTTDNNSRIPYRSQGQMVGVFEKMERWLSEQAEISEPHSTFYPRVDGLDGPGRARQHFFSLKYAKPFSVSDDSVVRQLKGSSLNNTGSKRIDPMKVLCHYELNGVCNDNNCSNYHQKDYEPVVSEMNNIINDCADEDADADGARVLKTDEMDQLLVVFAEFRGRIMKKWPVISSTQTSSTAGETNSDKKIAATDVPSYNGADATVPVAQDVEGEKAEPEEDFGDFILLDTREELPETSDARYFDDIDSRKAYGDMLQAKVEEYPSDTDAWLLFAIYQLELEVGLSDEAVNLSDDDRLHQQLLYLCKELNLNYRSGTSRTLAIEEAKLKRQVTNRQTEIDMVEQGVQFLPNSHALWLHYISTYDFDSVGMVEGIYWRLLEHLARENSAEDGSNTSKPTPTKELSILLTAISFHLCMKLWRAGATNRVLEFLSALLQFGDMSSEFACCRMVRGRLRDDELIAICLSFAHVLLFEELPGLIEHWVAASSYECIPVKGLVYTAESLRRGKCDIEGNMFARTLASYELAFQTLQNGCDMTQDAGNIILNNWMLVLAFQAESSKNDEPLRRFMEEKLDTFQQYSGASLVAAQLMGLKSSGEQRAHQLMLSMMNRSSDTHFPEALHHYLFACRQSPALVDALDKTFPDVMERLASFLDVDIDKVEKSIQYIMHDTSNISKSRALKALLEALLAAWMDQLAQPRGSKQDQFTVKQTRSPADIYVVLDICHLMGILLEPSAAVDGIQIALSSSSFGALSLESRQLAWMQRFVFQVDLLQQEDSGSLLWKEQQARLTGLFRKYMLEMSVEAEMVRQVSRRIKLDIARNAVADAVCDCLYPERSQIVTYDVSMELFRLCSAAVARSEKAAFYASFTDALALSPVFSLSFSGILSVRDMC
ncbi:hypothetical protein PHYPSEUDO_007504 [Phytophthora pseudosyringae]|uniref:Putative zinc-finger domain-containing protein n=1 Tax=Phytophthora pseudosyringae TaxID=221518 RepID=A0A8T1WE31_9STRA|nr:hypothetical protein PHYPSEUDO_007504 [Phytophthora pseudosyringae]